MEYKRCNKYAKDHLKMKQKKQKNKKITITWVIVSCVSLQYLTKLLTRKRNEEINNTLVISQQITVNKVVQTLPTHWSYHCINITVHEAVSRFRVSNMICILNTSFQRSCN